MRVDVLSGQEALASFDWGPIVNLTPALSSPFFQPTFASIVAEARATCVAVVDDGAAFLPFHRYPLGIGKALGNGLSDYQGLITETLDRIDLRQVLRKAGLSAYEFNHAPASQTGLASVAAKSAISPRVTLPHGGVSKSLRDNAKNRWRKLEREFGPITFEFDNRRAADFEQCLAWKREQYFRTGNYDILSDPWALEVLHRTMETHLAEYSGILSTIKAGQYLVAAHFGIRSHKTLHYWFPSYNPIFSQFSPGMLLLLSIIDIGPSFDIEIIDFGKGEQFYKSRLANDETEVFEGSLSVNLLGRLVVDSRTWLRDFRRNYKRPKRAE